MDGHMCTDTMKDQKNGWAVERMARVSDFDGGGYIEQKEMSVDIGWPTRQHTELSR